MSKTAKLRAASARIRNLLIRCNDVADQLEEIGRKIDSGLLHTYASQMARMSRRLSDDADLARDPRGAPSAGAGNASE